MSLNAAASYPLPSWSKSPRMCNLDAGGLPSNRTEGQIGRRQHLLDRQDSGGSRSLGTRLCLGKTDARPGTSQRFGLTIVLSKVFLTLDILSTYKAKVVAT